MSNMSRKYRKIKSFQEDCLDMVPDFINPLRFDNRKGHYLELDCHTLTLGDRVRRGPDWIFSDQDLGLPGTAVGYDRKGRNI